MDKVSVIVPVYQADKWIDHCLDSIKTQSYQNVELIVIDDSQASGAAAARNRGLDKATGEYVMFVDADDYLREFAIEHMVEAMDGVEMVAGSFMKFGLFEERVVHITQTMTMFDVAQYAMGNLLNPRKNQLLSGCWAKLYRRNMVKKFPDLTTAEDMAFNYDYLTRCDNARFISNLVYNNRKRPGSLSTTYDKKNQHGLFGFIEGLEYVQNFLSSFYSESEINRAADMSKIYHSMLSFMRICEQEGGSMREVFRKLYP